MPAAMSSRVVRTSSIGRSFGILEVPVDVALAGDVGAGVAAAHRYDDVGLLCEFAGETLGAAVGEVDVELAHDLDDLGVDVVVGVGDAAGGERVVTSARCALEQGGAHLRAAGVMQADE
jgi:hypothetical protein